MAVNLLSLAGALGKTLHNTPTSTKRNNSYAPGTSYGNKIPGTNLKKGAGLKNLASKGRRGDTKIRKVKGRTSHVNTTEANVIDSLGPLGEAWVERIGSGTINPQTGLPEYGFGSWLKKRVTPPKAVREAVSKGDIGGAIGGMWDSNKGAIVGGALALATGGTSLLAGAALGAGAKMIGDNWGDTWKPSEGKWGIFGQTDASKERDAAKAKAAASHKMFEDFRRNYEDENIAGIFTEDADDNSPKVADYSGTAGYEDMIKTHSGLEVGENDIADYTDEYDERKETEIGDKLTRDLKAVNIAGDAIDAKSKGVGSGLSSGLFGMLTQAQDSTSQKGFAGSGDFAADFAKTQAVKEAESQFGGIDRDIESLKLEREGVVADAASGVQDLQEDYNQEFWNNMVSWDSAVNT